MATLSLRLPESLHRKLAELAKSEGISINQLVATAAAEKLSALTTESYLAERAARASRSRFESALATVPDAPPSYDDDALPVGYRQPAAKKLANKGVNLTAPKKRRG
jgi:post-segregation antitoxin (ccd killing protein)